jgi:hypothetical protein
MCSMGTATLKLVQSSMTFILSSTLQRDMHCQKPSGFGSEFVLFAHEAQYRPSLSILGRENILGCIAEWVNADRLKQSGRCWSKLAPT